MSNYKAHIYKNRLDGKWVTILRTTTRTGHGIVRSHNSWHAALRYVNRVMRPHDHF